MTVPEIYRVLLLLLGIEDPAAAVESVADEILSAVNKAVQMLAASGEDFYGREPITVALATGTESYTLSKDIQTVLEPVLLADGTPLRAITSRGQYRNFGQLFLGQLTNTLANGKPIAFFVESRHDTTADEPDSVAMTMHFLPPPSTDYNATTALLDVIKQPVALVAADLADDAAIIPVPHKYLETVFLPIARWNVTNSPYFIQSGNLPRYKADYDMAVQILSGIDPRMPKPPDSNPRNLESAPVAQAA